jgi:ABC-2 type transport system permease protein
MLAIVRKELADLFNSVRFFVLFILVLLASGCGLYAVQQGIRAALEQNQAVTEGGFIFLALFTSSFHGIPIMTLAIAIIVPITGIVLGFDAINSERTGGTMSRLLAQPVYRDGVINGKFLAGLITMSLMVGTALLLVAGFGLRIIGVPPTAEEIIRLFIYFVITVIYGAFWMALAMLFSVLFRRAAGSLLIPIVLFIFLFFFWMFLGLGPAIANSIVPVDSNSQLELQIRNLELQETLLRLSPSYLFQEAFSFILNPVMMGMGVITTEQASFMVPNPLSLGQTLLAVWPHIVGLISLSVVLFAISYIVFMKQEIRAT